MASLSQQVARLINLPPPRLRGLRLEADNKNVRATRFLERLAVPILAFCLAGGAFTVSMAAQSGAPQAAPKTRPVPPPEDRVDINHASAVELLKVPGMTPSWAGRVIRYRPYRTKQDLLDRGIVPSGVYDRIKDYVIAHREKQ